MQLSRAPTVGLFFSEATVWKIIAALDEVAEQFQLTNSDSVEWLFPTSEHWRVRVRFDDKALENCTENEKELVLAQVGTAPSARLNLVLNLWALDDACDAAKILIVHLLGKFHGIVDDGSSEDSIWSIEQIRDTKRGVEFLDCYRQKSGDRK